jgi:uncharacterized C2H2 Zn-finger protein
MAQCEKCGREFKTEHALKIHVGRTHGAGKAKKAKAARKAGKLACPECGRTFGLAMHLARHRSAAHGAGLRGKPGRKPGRRLGRKPGPKPGRKAAARSPLAQLTIDDLLTLRSQIDARLADIARQMRQANIRF